MPMCRRKAKSFQKKTVNSVIGLRRSPRQSEGACRQTDGVGRASAGSNDASVGTTRLRWLHRAVLSCDTERHLLRPYEWIDVTCDQRRNVPFATIWTRCPRF